MKTFLTIIFLFQLSFVSLSQYKEKVIIYNNSSNITYKIDFSKQEVVIQDTSKDINLSNVTFILSNYRGGEIIERRGNPYTYSPTNPRNKEIVYFFGIRVNDVISNNIRVIITKEQIVHN